MRSEKLLTWLIIGSFCVCHHEAAPKYSLDMDFLVLMERFEALQKEVDRLSSIVDAQSDEVRQCISKCPENPIPDYSKASMSVALSVPFVGPREVEPQHYSLNLTLVDNELIEYQGDKLPSKEPNAMKSSKAMEDPSLEVSGNSEEDYYEAECEFKTDPIRRFTIQGTLVFKQKINSSEPVQISGRLSGFSTWRPDLYTLLVLGDKIGKGFCLFMGEGLRHTPAYTREIEKTFLITGGEIIIDFPSSLYDLVGNDSYIGKTIVIHPNKMSCCVVKPTKNIPSGLINPTVMRFNG